MRELRREGLYVPGVSYVTRGLRKSNVAWETVQLRRPRVSNAPQAAESLVNIDDQKAE